MDEALLEASELLLEFVQGAVQCRAIVGPFPLYPNGMTGGVAGDFDTEPDVPLTRVLAFGELDVGGDAVVENATCMSNSFANQCTIGSPPEVT